MSEKHIDEFIKKNINYILDAFDEAREKFSDGIMINKKEFIEIEISIMMSVAINIIAKMDCCADHKLDINDIFKHFKELMLNHIEMHRKEVCENVH